MRPYLYIFGLPIASYGLCMTLGIFLAAVLSFLKGRREGLVIEDIIITAALAMGCGILGGGGLYVFVTYSMEEIINFLRQGDFSFIGGIVFYGGLIGGIGGGLLGIWLARCPFDLAARSIVPFIPLGHAVGRIGCVMGGCCYGFDYDGPFALYYPNSLTGLDPLQGHFPVQPLEALLNVGICIFLLYLDKKLKNGFHLLFSYLGLYAITRFCLEFLRGDSIRGVWAVFSTSQWVSLGLLIGCISYFAVVLIRKHKQP